MNLYCDTCHTCWTEAVLQVWGCCPFRDCGGILRAEPPVNVRQRVKYVRPKDYPLLEQAEAEPE